MKLDNNNGSESSALDGNFFSGDTTKQEDPTSAKQGLADAIMPAAELLKRKILQRPAILGDWMKEGDYGYIFAPRGDGKSWLSMLLGNAIAEGKGLGKWDGASEERRVFYFDAEMNLPDIQSRAKEIGINSKHFYWLQHEEVFRVIKKPLNIADRADQESISELLNDGDVFVIDNLSTATSGIEESSGDDFSDLLKGWLLEMRNRQITVIIVHHAGRNGNMRGTSRREDMAHWIISLRKDTEDDGPTAFVTNFVKCRNCPYDKAPPLRWTIDSSDGKLSYTCELHKGKDAMLNLIRAGVESASDLAEELSVSKGCVSKWAKQLVGENPPKIKIEQRKYIAN